VVPQFVDHLTTDTRIQFSFRPKAPDKNAQTQIESGGSVLSKRKHPHVIPSEMINVITRLDPSAVKNKEITVRIVPTAAEGSAVE
jgi:hypothetical protein